MSEKDKLAELHNFLKHDVEVSFLDGDVIDVAMDVISKHIERIKNLEKLLSTHEPHGRNYTNGQYVKLIERVQELEDFKRNAEQLYKYHHLSAKKSVAEKEELREQNKRYREALEEIKKEEAVTTGLSNGQVAYTRSGHIARKALESESND